MSACRQCKKRIRRGSLCQACAQPSALEGRRATVMVERCGASIRVDDVDAMQAAAVLADMLMAFRALTREFSELVVDLTPVPGGSPVDGDASEFGARVGFRTISLRDSQHIA